jgi:2',3'-cyclic-nucleotide 2'-phosphodiesterase (5'-nucleotidase family)
VALVEKLRAEGTPVLVLDSGDLFFMARVKVDPEKALAKARLIGRAYRRMAAAAVNVGDLDLLRGLDFLRQEASQGLPLISANLLDPSSRTPIFDPYVIQKVSGIKIAFFGLLSPNFQPEIADPIQKTVGESIFIKDPVETAREMVLKLRDKVDMIALLSDLGSYRDRELVKAVPGIHFVLGGHEGLGLVQPNREGNTYMFQSYAKGMYVGTLRLVIKNPSLPFQDESRVSRIQEQIHNLDRHLQALQKQQASQPSQEVAQRIQWTHQQKAKLKEQLMQFSGAQSQENHFLWTLVALNPSLREDEDTKGWIKETGIDQD